MQEHKMLSKALDGPASLLQRLSAALPRLGAISLDTDYWLMSMPEYDPEFITYLQSEGLLARSEREANDEVWRL